MKMMKILITGARGQLGSELLGQADRRGINPRAESGSVLKGTDAWSGQTISFGRSELDITNPIQIENAISKVGPDLVVNVAAYTAVDRAETEKEAAFAVNRDGPANLARTCAKAKIPLIHISTDFVFDGNKRIPYTESDPISPLGIYGKSKAAGEDAIRSELAEHIILRTSWLYSSHGANFVKTMLRIGEQRDALGVVADQSGCPTSAADLAEAILLTAERIRNRDHIPWGTYHYCGAGITTWHGFAEAVFALAARYACMRIPRVKPISTAEYPTPARRPAFSALDCGRIRERFGIRTQPWEESLEKIIKHLLRD